jgi:O-succinylbenzoate synthase
MPLTTRFRTGWGEVTSRRTVLVRLTSEQGFVGWGEAAALTDPLYSEEASWTCLEVLSRYLVPSVLRVEANHVGAFLQHLPPVRGHRFARSGLEAAIWDLTCQANNVSLARALGGTREVIEVGEAIGIKDSIADLLEEVGLRLRQGFRHIKLKVKPGWDLQPARAVRSEFGDVSLSVDANGSYGLDDLDVFLQMDPLGLSMIEQPFDPDDLWDHSRLQQRLETPLCLDESIRSAADARRAIEMGACRIVNIKQGRVGGLTEAVRIHDICQEAGLPVWCGGMLESGLGRAVAIALASLPNFRLPADLSPSHFFYREDVLLESYQVERGQVRVPTGPGLGFEPDTESINRLTLERRTFGEEGPA